MDCASDNGASIVLKNLYQHELLSVDDEDYKTQYHFNTTNKNLTVRAVIHTATLV